MNALLLLLASAAAAPPSLPDVPAIDREADDFFGAVADAPVAVAWSADRDRVPLDGELVLMLTVSGAANPGELTRPSLRGRPGIAARFQVEDGPDPPTTNGDVRYAYRLRPRRVGDADLPPLRYRYYRPRFPDGRRMQATRTGVLRIVVTPSAPGRPAAVPVAGPESFFTLPTDATPVGVSRWAWLGPVGLVPVAVGGWVWGRRARSPAASRSRSARIALAKLAAVGAAADPGGEVATILRTYLGVPATARTPAEVAAALLASGWPAERAAAAEQLLRECDAARFAPQPAIEGLPTRAAVVITSWEDAG